MYVPLLIISMYVSCLNPHLGAEQNTQADVFKDTKHLMLSVIDGYNVCIFAYGNNRMSMTYYLKWPTIFLEIGRD